MAISLAATLLVPSAAPAQRTLDRVDPAKVEQTVRAKTPAAPTAAVPLPATPPPAPRVAAVATPVTVGAIVLTGLTVLHPSDFADVIDLYVGRTLSPPALAGLADAITARLHARGYVLATAQIPRQALSAGVLRVAVDEGAIDGIRIKGDANRAVEAALMPLVGTGPVRLPDLERRLLIAGDIDGIWLRRSRLVREGARNVLEVEIRRDRVSGAIGVDNSGSRPIGPIQADVSVNVSQLIAEDDVVTFSEVISPTQPNEFAYLRVRYGKRVGRGGTEVSASVSYARTAPGAYLAPRDIDGRSWTARVDVLHPLLRRRAASLWLSGSFGIRSVSQDRRDRLVRRDRITAARVGVNGFAQVAGGQLRANATVAQGLDLFDATDADDPFASREDADGRFTTVTLAGDWIATIVPDVSARIAVATQWAAGPLLASEEIGLGGGDFVRGYDYSERSGDSGTMASGELRWAPVPTLGFVATPSVYGFVDGGRVVNRRGGFGSGTLFSTGFGVRGDVAKLFGADLGLAFPLSGRRYDSGDSDPVVNFRLVRRF